MAPVCTPYAAFCSQNHKRQCQWSGLDSDDYGACAAGTYCVEQGNAVTCQPTPCSAGAVGCLSEKLGTCATDGMSLASVASDCGAQSKLCTPQGCAAQALDILGASDQVGVPSGTVMGDVIRVQSARTITQIEAYLSFPASRALTWVIYEAVDASTFNLVFSSGTTGVGAGFQSSGPISYALQAGKSYFIGVGVTGSYVAYYGSAAGQKPLSFGIALGTGAASATSNAIYVFVAPDQLYYFRLTTKP